MLLVGGLGLLRRAGRRVRWAGLRARPPWVHSPHGTDTVRHGSSPTARRRTVVLTAVAVRTATVVGVGADPCGPLCRCQSGDLVRRPLTVPTLRERARSGRVPGTRSGSGSRGAEEPHRACVRSSPSRPCDRAICQVALDGRVRQAEPVGGRLLRPGDHLVGSRHDSRHRRPRAGAPQQRKHTLTGYTFTPRARTLAAAREATGRVVPPGRRPQPGRLFDALGQWRDRPAEGRTVLVHAPSFRRIRGGVSRSRSR